MDSRPWAFPVERGGLVIVRLALSAGGPPARSADGADLQQCRVVRLGRGGRRPRGRDGATGDCHVRGGPQPVAGDRAGAGTRLRAGLPELSGFGVPPPGRPLVRGPTRHPSGMAATTTAAITRPV